LHQPKEAVACYQEVVRLMPDSAEALASLGWVQWEADFRLDAVTTFKSAIRLEPELTEKFTNLAMQLATDPEANRRDPYLAFELASLAVASSPDASASALDALAAAQAALGRFADAVHTATRALAKAYKSQQTQLSQSIAEHLHCYKKQTAFIQPSKVKAP